MTSQPTDQPHAGHSHELAQDLPALSREFGLGAVSDYSYLAHGLMNPNWRVQTDLGVFAVKRIVDVPLEQARRNLAIPAAVAAAGLPACVPLAAGSERVVEPVFGRGYCAFPWVEGVHIEGWRLSVEQARDFGELVGRLHHALGEAGRVLGWPSVPTEARAKVTEPHSALQEAERFLGVIGALGDPEPFDRAAVHTLHQRKALLAEHAVARPGTERPLGPLGWTHGDLQYRNLLWRDERIAAVLDWDRVAVRPLAEEVVRTAQVQFATYDGWWDLERAGAFVVGYRSVVDLAEQDLRDAAARLWWKRMTDFWPLQLHYDKGDVGCDALWRPGEALLDWWSTRRELVAEALVGQGSASPG